MEKRRIQYSGSLALVIFHCVCEIV